MRIRILRAVRGSTDGVDLRLLQVGFTYDVSPALGAQLVASRCGEIVASQDPMLLVPLVREPQTTSPTARMLDVADEFSRRESLLAYEPAESK